jgi:hypothetical protein
MNTKIQEAIRREQEQAALVAWQTSIEEKIDAALLLLESIVTNTTPEEEGGGGV